MKELTLGIDDVAAVAALMQAHDIAVLGHWDYTMAELEADLRNDEMHHVGWYDDRGQLVASGWFGEGGDTSKVRMDFVVHPDVEDASVGLQCLAFLEGHARELATARGHDHAVLDIGAYRQDERTRGWLRERDFEHATTFTRMRIDLPEPVTVPGPPAGVVGRASDGAEDDLRTAHAVLVEAFAEHYGHVHQTYEEWRKKYTEHGPGWSSLWLADVDGVPLGALVGTEQFVPDENAGYVRSLGVLPAARGRGAAKHLLRTYFAAAQAEGRGAVILHVDIANVTGALALYESVGMRRVLEFDAWIKRVS